MAGRLLLILLAFWSASAADSFEEEHAAHVAANPPSVRFEARFAEPRAAYRVGERIALKLSFASDREETYRLNGAQYDRSGRLGVDRFVVDRSEGVTDPLAWYYGSGVAAGMAGGIRGYPTLGVEPIELEADLNEWLRFDSPGRYRIYLVSSRIGRMAPSEGDSSPLPVASRILQLEILPRNAQANAATLATASAALERVSEYKDPFPIPRPLPMELGKEAERAVQSLRYLGTEDAVDALLDAHGMVRGLYDGPITLALAASGQRRYLRGRLLFFLQEPRYSLPGDLFHLLVVGDVAAEFPSVLAWTPGKVNAATVAEVRKRQKRYEEIATDYAHTLAKLTPGKTPAARKADFRLIERYLPKEAELLRPLVEDAIPSPAQFLAMGVEEQTSWLYGRRWERLRETNILPALLELLPTLRTERPLDPTALRKSLAWAAALERIAELEPLKAQALALADLAQDSPMANTRSLTRVLPDGVYPEIDEPTMARLERRATSEDALILARYASPAVYDRAFAMYQSVDPAPCNLEQNLLAYLARVRPAEGAALVEQALANRMNRGCWRSLLTAVGRLAWSPQIEAVALRQLDDPGAEAALNAAGALANHRNGETREAIWKRLEAGVDEGRMRQSLQQALRCAPGRLWSGDDSARWSKVCPDCKAPEAGETVSLYLQKGIALDRAWTIRLDGCVLRSPAELMERLKLYASGTVVEWQPSASSGSGDAETLFKSIRLEAEGRGIVLRRAGKE